VEPGSRGLARTAPSRPDTVMLNSFQHPLFHEEALQPDKWTLKQVQGDGIAAKAPRRIDRTRFANHLAAKARVDPAYLPQGEMPVGWHPSLGCSD